MNVDHRGHQNIARMQRRLIKLSVNVESEHLKN